MGIVARHQTNSPKQHTKLNHVSWNPGQSDHYCAFYVIFTSLLPCLSLCYLIITNYICCYMTIACYGSNIVSVLTHNYICYYIIITVIRYGNNCAFLHHLHLLLHHYNIITLVFKLLLHVIRDFYDP